MRASARRRGRDPQEPTRREPREPAKPCRGQGAATRTAKSGDVGEPDVNRRRTHVEDELRLKALVDEEERVSRHASTRAPIASRSMRRRDEAVELENAPVATAGL